MSRARVFPLFAAIVAVGAGLVAGAVARSGGPFDGREHSNEPPATGPQRPVPLRESNPAAAQDEAKPRYQGRLGDFLIVPSEAADFPCPAQASTDPRASELYSPVFSEAAVAGQCADGRIVGISDYGEEAIGRRYFVGPAKVPYEAPVDRLTLLTIGGKPAIAQLPMPGVPSSLRLAVIERLPSDDQPGILVWIDNTDRSLAEAIALANRIMGVQQ